MNTRTTVSSLGALAFLAMMACSNTATNPGTGSGGAPGTGGDSSRGGSGGKTGTGGGTGTGGTSATGGSSSTGGTTSSGGSSNAGGSSVAGGSFAGGGSSTTGGRVATGGTTAIGGSTGSGAGGTTNDGGGSVDVGATGGAPRTGGTTGAGGTTRTGGSSGLGGVTALGGTSGGDRDGGADLGSDSGSGGFNPCPSNGDPCKILPLGDSITWGINYGGGYRIKLFSHTVTDGKNITFVGYDTANPPSSTALASLGSASSKWVGKHEGHSGWTIQQDDDLVTGKSTATNDGVSYTGKKVVADFGPHIVLVHLGTNDMSQNPNGADTRLGTLIDHIVTDAPNALVVVSSIIPFPSKASAVSTFNKAVPGVVKQRADGGKHVIYVDQFSALTNADLGSDQIHPNEGGYEKMAVAWYTGIKSYLH